MFPSQCLTIPPIQAQGLLCGPCVRPLQPIRQFLRLSRTEDASKQVVHLRNCGADVFLDLVRPTAEESRWMEDEGWLPLDQSHCDESCARAGEIDIFPTTRAYLIFFSL